MNNFLHQSNFLQFGVKLKLEKKDCGIARLSCVRLNSCNRRKGKARIGQCCP